MVECLLPLTTLALRTSTMASIDKTPYFIGLTRLKFPAIILISPRQQAITKTCRDTKATCWHFYRLGPLKVAVFYF